MSELDVVVVGAGLTGAIVARRVTTAGGRCVVLEAGPRGPKKLPAAWGDFTRATAGLAEVDEERWPIRSSRELEWMRVRAVGGRTLLWGGWMLRPDDQSLSASRAAGRPWPMTFDQLDARARAAARVLRVQSAPPGELVCRLRGIGLAAQPKRAALGPGRKRPLCAQDLLAGTKVVEHAAVVGVVVSGRHARGVVVRGVDGRTSTVAARSVVLACSAVETARVLSDTDGLDVERIGNPLMDHLYCGFMCIVKTRVSRGSAALDGAAFVAPERSTPGLDFSLEVRGPVSLGTLDDEDLGLLGIARVDAEHMAYYAVFAIGEMDPSVGRAVRFDGRRRDPLGRSVPTFELPRLSVDERTLAGRMRARCGEIAKLLAGAGGTIVQVRDPRDRLLGHEAGTCPMGSTRRRGVTDLDGAVHGARGLYLADASRMPTALDRHPSLTLAGLSLRTAERVIEDLR